MANTRIQHEVEEWIRSHGLLDRFKIRFDKKQLQLNTGGRFEFDAVSEDGKIAVVISTSTAKTSGGRPAIGKMHKIRSDILFLVMADAPRRVVAFTERSLWTHFKAEKERGRIPLEIELEAFDIPAEMNARLMQAREAASLEVRPRTNSGGEPD